MKPEKFDFTKIEKYELADISPLIENKTITSLQPQFEDIVSNESDLAEVRLNYNSGWDRKSNGLAPDARKRFLEADKSYHLMTNTNITIHISKRDVFKQAELYIKNTYYGEGSPVSWPGCSMHNWGLALDLARPDDRNLVEAMKEQGWTQTDEIGGWHFECTGSRDYEKAAKMIKAFRSVKSGLAYKWSEQVALYYRKREILNKRVPIFNKRLEKNKADSQKLIAEADSFNVDAQSLKSRTNRFNSEITKYNMEISKAEKILAEIITQNEMQVKSNKHETYTRLCEWIENEALRIQGEIKNINKENKELNDWNMKIQYKLADYLREENWLAIENKVLEKLTKEIELHKSNATMHLMSIDSQTWK
jgi:predicted  nucleic acid-binding Zn-ribbon protein